MTDTTQDAPEAVASPPVSGMFKTNYFEVEGDLDAMAGDLAKVAAATGTIKAADTAEVKGKTKDGRPFDYQYSYAGLPSVLAQLLPALTAQKICLLQIPRTSPKVVGVTSLVVGQGWRIRTDLDLMQQSLGPQDVAKTISYARRYAVLALFSLSPEEDDGSGSGAQEAYNRGRQQQNRRQDEAKGRGSKIVDPKIITDAFAKYEVTEAALVAELGGTPLGKMADKAQTHLRKCLKRLQAGEGVEDVLGSAALQVLMAPKDENAAEPAGNGNASFDAMFPGAEGDPAGYGEGDA